MYATADDMRARFGEADLVQLTDTPAWGALTIAALNLKLADATARCDGYVAKYYAPQPGSAVPPLLVAICCDLAYERLFKAPTDDAAARAKAAHTDLVNISKGLIKLDQGRGDLPARDGAVIVPAGERTFSRDRLTGF
jgi:phage gp36-like protein